jgi:hypothetical protein
MRVKFFDRHFHGDWLTVDISFIKWLILKVTGGLLLRYDAKPMWKGKLPFYIVRCRRHGYYLDYPHGFNAYFICPFCSAEVEHHDKKAMLEPGRG